MTNKNAYNCDTQILLNVRKYRATQEEKIGKNRKSNSQNTNLITKLIPSR